MPEPVVLRPDNFTPPSRTPWGGRRIRELKAELGLAEGPPVGESWEVSVEPSFPSQTRDGRLLAEVIAAAPEAWLGAASLARFGASTPLLVKLLDADDDLSVQVHPADGDAALAPDESGKPEAWVVLEAEPGAGLYLGFREGVGRDDVVRCLAEGGALDTLMSFVPVRAGDAFVIEAGTPHAIGRGLTLLEPQFVAPGRRGVTYRYWDWNRRYDAEGRRDPAGGPRTLHVERSLAVTAWEAPRGEAFVAQCRSPRVPLPGGTLTRAQLVAWSWFSVEAWEGDGTTTIPAPGQLLAIVCVGGHLTLESSAGSLELRCGESGLVPASAGALTIAGRGLRAFAVR